MDSKIILCAPVRGNWSVFNPPGHPKCAFDLVAIEEFQNINPIFSWLDLFKNKHVEETLAWNKPIYSPVSGTIVELNKSSKDRNQFNMFKVLIELGFKKHSSRLMKEELCGNYVVIKSRDYYVLLCHLRYNSILNNLGDEIEVGHLIGCVGNSGFSLHPHLHIQVMSSPNILPLYENLLPFYISYGEEYVKGDICPLVNFKLKNLKTYIF